MRLRSLAPLALTLAVSALQAQETPPRFRARTDLVVVDVVVTDGQGKPVEGLKREDFRLFEDGKGQDLATFEAVSAGAAPASDASEPGAQETGAQAPAPGERTIAILFDDLHLRPLDAERLKPAIRELLAAESAARTRVALIAPGAGVASMGQLPASRPDLEAVLGQLKGYVGPDEAPNAPMSEQEAYQIHELRDQQAEMVVAERFLLRNLAGNDAATARSEVRAKAAEIDAERAGHRQSTLDALGKTLGWLAGAKGRRTLVLASRGFVYDHGSDGYRKTIEASRRANVPVHLLDARSLEGANPEMGMQQAASSDQGLQAHGAQATANRFAEAEGAEHVALDTGGLVIRKRNDPAAGLRLLADASRSYYLLGYYPRNERRDGKWRKLKVELVKAPPVSEVRARRGYFAPLD